MHEPAREITWIHVRTEPGQVAGPFVPGPLVRLGMVFVGGDSIGQPRVDDSLCFGVTNHPDVAVVSPLPLGCVVVDNDGAPRVPPVRTVRLARYQGLRDTPP